MIKRSEIFKNYFFEFLEELSDRAYQENIWTNKDNPDGLISSFVEAVIGLYDDAVVMDSLKEGSVIYDKKVTQALWDLSAAIDNIDDSQSPDDIINDPLMQIVREKASEILRLVRISNKSQNTVKFIEEGTLKELYP